MPFDFPSPSVSRAWEILLGYGAALEHLADCASGCKNEHVLASPAKNIFEWKFHQFKIVGDNYCIIVEVIFSVAAPLQYL